VVSFGGEPAEIPDSLVAAIRTRLDEINASTEATADGYGRRPADFEQGQAVVILDGPFSGCEAIFDAYLSGLDRVRVLLQFLRVNQTKLVLPVSKIQTTNQH
jgi:transcriptional antiterminator RfaH